MDSKYPNFTVSIHCFTYNQANFIVDAMNGFCMQQTTFPYVAIIVDDASTDGEPDVIRGYLNAHFNMAEAREWENNDAHYIYARHTENKNCYFAVILLKYNFYSIKKDKEPLYKEFEETVKYIALCEGDDYWIAPQKIQIQKEYLDNHPECSYLFTNRKILANGIIKTQYEKKTVYETKDILAGLTPGIQTVMHRNINNLKKLCDTMVPHVNGDIGWAYVFATIGEIHCLPDVTAVYRYSGYGVYSSLTPTQRFYTSIEQYYVFHKGLNFPENNALRSFYNWQLRSIALSHIKNMEYKDLLNDIIFTLRHCPTISVKITLLINFCNSTIKDLFSVIYNKIKVKNRQ